MRYTTEEGGRLNNFAVEPKVYGADAPNKNQQRNYIILGVGALTLVGSLMAVAVAASNVS
ncbi:MAG: ssl1498 family light-harvesting-like protein [Spirulinaceae cyanobacterium]